MIPRRITLEGFLCYEGERTIDLDGADLWVFTGRNGSGKSAVFDAITFALFGTHRGGKQDFASLIHQDRDLLRVEFEFELGPERYRITRSLRRKGPSERQVYRHAPEEGRFDQWPAVPETSDEGKFKEWVDEKIGMSVEAFTASVLLRQGEADRLIAAKAKERFDILSGVVDLARYRDLAEAADARRKTAEGEAKALSARLGSLPTVAPEAVEDARRLAAEAEVDRARADEGRERLLVVEREAREWSDLVARRDGVFARLAAAENLLSDSVAIERDAARLGELSAALPILGPQVGRAARIDATRGEVGRLERETADLGRVIVEIGGLFDEAERHRRVVDEEASEAGARRARVDTERAALELPIDRARRAAGLSRTIADLARRIAVCPPDLAGRVEAIEADRARAEGTRAAIPWLEMLAEGRSGLADDRDALDEASEEIARLGSERRRLSDDRVLLAGRSAEAEQAGRSAEDRVIRETMLVDQHRARLVEFLGLDGLAACDRCGRPLTPAHFDEESRRLREALDAASARLGEAEEESRRAESLRTADRRAVDDLDGSIARVDARLGDAGERTSKAVNAAEGHAASCLRAYRSLEEARRPEVSAGEPDDWSTTTFPAAADLERAHSEVGRIGALETSLAEARLALESLRSDRAGLDRARLALEEIGIEPEDGSAEGRHAALVEEIAGLDRRSGDVDGRLAQAVQNVDGLREKKKGRSEAFAAAERKLAAEHVRFETLDEDRATARAALPERWRSDFDTISPGRLAPLTSDRDKLEGRGVEARAAALPGARLVRDEARGSIDDLDAEIARIALESRRDPGGVAIEFDLAKLEVDAASRRANALGVEAERLERQFDERRTLAGQALDAQQRAAVAAKLAGLLGWEGLQRQLLRDAERAIVEHANPILAEISGGEMSLRLCAEGEAGRALELEAQVRTHGRTRSIKAPYLSGSQRFRVAVSLALAIGRSMRHGRDRPIETVVIDEGFGSLDAQGRRDMIAQLRDLKGLVARIILVSHQEDFADAFDDGYRFEIVDGATSVERFSR